MGTPQPRGGRRSRPHHKWVVPHSPSTQWNTTGLKRNEVPHTPLPGAPETLLGQLPDAAGPTARFPGLSQRVEPHGQTRLHLPGGEDGVDGARGGPLSLKRPSCTVCEFNLNRVTQNLNSPTRTSVAWRQEQGVACVTLSSSVLSTPTLSHAPSPSQRVREGGIWNRKPSPLGWDPHQLSGCPLGADPGGPGRGLGANHKERLATSPEKGNFGDKCLPATVQGLTWEAPEGPAERPSCPHWVLHTSPSTGHHAPGRTGDPR